MTEYRIDDLAREAGTTTRNVRVYQDNGLSIITQYARLLGCWTKESGVLNSVVFLWGYDDFGHRSAQRAKMGADPRWQAFVPACAAPAIHTCWYCPAMHR